MHTKHKIISLLNASYFIDNLEVILRLCVMCNGVEQLCVVLAIPSTTATVLSLKNLIGYSTDKVHCVHDMFYLY